MKSEQYLNGFGLHLSFNIVQGGHVKFVAIWNPITHERVLIVQLSFDIKVSKPSSHRRVKFQNRLYKLH
jgi:hypothetical protein